MILRSGRLCAAPASARAPGVYTLACATDTKPDTKTEKEEDPKPKTKRARFAPAAPAASETTVVVRVADALDVREGAEYTLCTWPAAAGQTALPAVVRRAHDTMDALLPFASHADRAHAYTEPNVMHLLRQYYVSPTALYARLDETAKRLAHVALFMHALFMLQCEHRTLALTDEQSRPLCAFEPAWVREFVVQEGLVRVSPGRIQPVDPFVRMVVGATVFSVDTHVLGRRTWTSSMLEPIDAPVANEQTAAEPLTWSALDKVAQSVEPGSVVLPLNVPEGLRSHRVFAQDACVALRALPEANVKRGDLVRVRAHAVLADSMLVGGARGAHTVSREACADAFLAFATLDALCRGPPGRGGRLPCVRRGCAHLMVVVSKTATAGGGLPYVHALQDARALVGNSGRVVVFES